jgi:hypothetical protein
MDSYDCALCHCQMVMNKRRGNAVRRNNESRFQGIRLGRALMVHSTAVVFKDQVAHGYSALYGAPHLLVNPVDAVFD